MGAKSINPQLPLAVVAGVIFSVTGLFAPAPDYVEDFKPLLRNKCSSCHSAKKQKAKLRMDADKFIHAGSTNKDRADISASPRAATRQLARYSAQGRWEK